MSTSTSTPVLESTRANISKYITHFDRCVVNMTNRVYEEVDEADQWVQRLKEVVQDEELLNTLSDFEKNAKDMRRMMEIVHQTQFLLMCQFKDHLQENDV